MKKEARALLQALLDAPSPSGYEGPARRVWCESLSSIAEVRVDVHGNAIASINADGAPHVMLAGHIDEIGFQICHIDDNGILRFRTIGGHDARTLTGRRVRIHTASGSLLGVIGQKPVHLIQDRNRQSGPPQISTLWIDAGFADRAEAEKHVEIGDAVTYDESFAPLRGELAIARGFDNRVGAFIAAETLRALARTKKLKARVSAVATVQEEIGLRGAYTSTFGLAPDVGLAIDVTWATDNPGGDAKEIGEVKLGRGPVLTRGPNINPALYALLKQAASDEKIAVQLRSSPGATGTDANAMQISRAGVATALLGVPNRYMHSPVEMCHLGDIDDCVKLLVAAIRKLDKKTSLIPE